MLILHGADEFCREVLEKQGAEDQEGAASPDELLVKRNGKEEKGRILLPESMRNRILNLTHSGRIRGNHGKPRMMEKLGRTFYWKLMAADVVETVRNCTQFAKNNIRLLKLTKKRKVFPTSQPFQSVGTDI